MGSKWYNKKYYACKSKNRIALKEYLIKRYIFLEDTPTYHFPIKLEDFRDFSTKYNVDYGFLIKFLDDKKKLKLNYGLRVKAKKFVLYRYFELCGLKNKDLKCFDSRMQWYSWIKGLSPKYFPSNRSEVDSFCELNKDLRLKCDFKQFSFLNIELKRYFGGNRVRKPLGFKRSFDSKVKFKGCEYDTTDMYLTDDDKIERGDYS